MFPQSHRQSQILFPCFFFSVEAITVSFPYLSPIFTGGYFRKDAAAVFEAASRCKHPQLFVLPLRNLVPATITSFPQSQRQRHRRFLSLDRPASAITVKRPNRSPIARFTPFPLLFQIAARLARRTGRAACVARARYSAIASSVIQTFEPGLSCMYASRPQARSASSVTSDTPNRAAASFRVNAIPHHLLRPIVSHTMRQSG